MAPSPSATARRRPRQARGQATVEAVLDAADALVAEHGVDALSTTAVAEHAGVAVGTLYQYFAGADALVDALVVRHAERFADALAGALAGQRFARKRDAANAALDAFIAHCRATPAFLALWQARPDAAVGATDAAGTEGGPGPTLAAVVVAALADQGLADPDDPAFALEVEVQWAVALALVQLAFARLPTGDRAVLAHLRRLFALDVRP